MTNFFDKVVLLGLDYLIVRLQVERLLQAFQRFVELLRFFESFLLFVFHYHHHHHGGC